MTTSTTTEAQVIFTRFLSPVGTLLLVGSRPREGRDGTLALSGIYFEDAPHAGRAFAEGVDASEDVHAFAEVIAQLTAYFERKRTTFDLPLAPRGTSFQRKVWDALSKIPYGETTSYAAIAEIIGSPKAVRAVGAANGRNPLSIVVPCHRVVGRDGALTGYAGGVPQKQALLSLEQR